MIEYNGLAHAQDKYVSLAYNIDSKWKIPLEKVAYILEPKTLHEERRSDILLEQLRVPELIDFVASHQKNKHCRFWILFTEYLNLHKIILTQQQTRTRLVLKKM